MKLMIEIDSKYYIVPMENLKKNEVSVEKFDAEEGEGMVLAVTIPAESIPQPEVEGQLDRPTYSAGRSGTAGWPAGPRAGVITRARTILRKATSGNSSSGSTSSGVRD